VGVYETRQERVTLQIDHPGSLRVELKNLLSVAKRHDTAAGHGESLYFRDLIVDGDDRSTVENGQSVKDRLVVIPTWAGLFDHRSRDFLAASIFLATRKHLRSGPICSGQVRTVRINTNCQGADQKMGVHLTRRQMPDLS
jgi:hypothetical protein